MPPGHVELALTGAVTAPHGQELSVPGELLHPVVQAVHHVQVVFLVEVNAGGVIQLTIASAGSTPLAYPATVLGKDGYAVQPLVGDVHVVLAVQGYPRRPHEAPVGHVALLVADVGYPLAEVPDVLFVGGEHGHPDAVGPEVQGPVNNVHPVPGAPGHGYGGEEARAQQLHTADGVAVLEGDPHGL